MPSVEELDKIAKEDEHYYDTLYNFAKVAINANDMALDGYSTDQIAKKLQQSAEAFYMLCKVDEVNENKQGRPKKGSDLIEEKPKEDKKTIPDHEPLPDNFMKDEDGWGLCPVCRKKILKLTRTTKLVNFPAYCKSCKADFIVNWWNVENKDITYTRYVNNKHYIDRRDIRSSAMKGTGVNSYLVTNTSATERVALNL